MTAAELSWGNHDHIRALEPPFDYIIGTDVVCLTKIRIRFVRVCLGLNWFNIFEICDNILMCYKVYAEHLLEPLLQTMLALSGPKTTILVIIKLASNH